VVAISAPEVLEASFRIASPSATLTLLAEVVTLFWPVQPFRVSQTLVLSEVPLNSSSKTSDQLPSTPAGLGPELVEEREEDEKAPAPVVELPVAAIVLPVDGVLVGVVVVGAVVVLVAVVVVVGVLVVVVVVAPPEAAPEAAPVLDVAPGVVRTGVGVEVVVVLKGAG
jgi:hypothetical protein